ncbi:hypothetical protein [Brevibacillus sp. MER 51]|uniref:hypothetical protein n=1 Tax=Brevibacillus sp. MER 51 TaxID=2939560 RepID=UPI0020416509|nr:hypothetical protein [Brevibacillus sp. MER 51]MCM3144401.1 hypothetical protein [Brevibacillus sp. MER 51]
MEYRRLGKSGLSVSEIALENWITHGAQVDDTTAKTCVHATLDAGKNAVYHLLELQPSSPSSIFSSFTKRKPTSYPIPLLKW